MRLILSCSQGDLVLGVVLSVALQVLARSFSGRWSASEQYLQGTRGLLLWQAMYAGVNYIPCGGDTLVVTPEYTVIC